MTCHTQRLTLMLILTAACSHANADRSQPKQSKPPIRAETSMPLSQSAGNRVSKSAATSIYKLSEHLERSELRFQDTLFIDFGSKNAAQYTLGGWRSNWGPSVNIGQTSASTVQGRHADIFFSALATNLQPTHIRLRLRALASKSITGSLNGRQLSAKTVKDRKNFATYEFNIPAHQVVRGENRLHLKVQSTKSYQTPSGKPLGRVGMLIDWAAIGNHKTLQQISTTPNQTSTQKHSQKNINQLDMRPSWTRSFTFIVPKHATFTGSIRSLKENASRLSIRLLAEPWSGKKTPSTQALTLATLTTTQPPKPFKVDLSAYADQTVRLDLQAQSALRIINPRIEIPRKSKPTEIKKKKIQNVVIFLIDTLRADKLAPYNESTRVQTPGLHQFIQHAAIFDNAHSQENWTKPSVATLLSSLFPWQHKATTLSAVLPRSVNTLPKILSKRGYRTAAFIANGYVSGKFGFKKGWNNYRNYIREGRRTRSSFVAKDVDAWLKRYGKKPFFLYIHTIDPHVPYRRTKFTNQYDKNPYKGIINFSKDSMLLEKIKMGSIKTTRRDKIRLEALYDGEISFHDQYFAQIMSSLNEQKLADNTLVILTSDHGEEFWDHGSVGHGHSIYEELIRIPFIVRVPGITTQTSHVRTPVGLVDILPTVLDALDEPEVATAQGRSIMPWLTAQEKSAPRITVSGFMDGWRTARVGPYKLVQRTPKKTTLYYLPNDKNESHDISQQRPLTTRYLKALLGLELARTGSTSKTHHPSNTKSQHKAESTTIDPTTKAQLKALGYGS